MASRPCLRCGTPVTRTRTSGAGLRFDWKDYSEDPEGTFVLRGVVVADLGKQPLELSRHTKRWSLHACSRSRTDQGERP